MQNRQRPRGEEPRKFVERRKKKDWVVQSVTIISLVGLTATAGIVFFLGMALPGENQEWLTILPVQVQKMTVSVSLLWVAVGLLAFNIAACITGFFLNMKRMRRKTDRYNKLVIFLGSLSVIVLTVLIFNYSSILF